MYENLKNLIPDHAYGIMIQGMKIILTQCYIFFPLWFMHKPVQTYSHLVNGLCIFI